MAQVKVFISHKNEDAAKANRIRDILGEHYERLEMFVASRSITAGEDWTQRIKNELRDSNMLLLLFTEPTRSWDWCLYETGLFTRLDEDQVRRVVCLYNERAQAPKPLKNLQGVQANLDAVTRFLGTFYRTTELTGVEPPLNTRISDETLGTYAQEICDLFESHLEPYYTCYRLHLTLPEEGESDGIPDSTLVHATERVFEVFGLGRGPHTWGKVVEGLDASDQTTWLEELYSAFRLACERRLFEPLTSTFRGADGAKIFRPVLYRVDLKERRPVAVVVVLNEELAPANLGSPLFNVLRLGNRFRHEIIQPHLEKLAEATDEDAAPAIHQLFESIKIVEQEAERQNLLNPEYMKSLFPEPSGKARIESMFAQWGDVRQQLEDAVQEANRTRVVQLLDKVKEMNRDFLLLAGRRYVVEIEAST